jgi:hypothetical protein
VDSLAVNLAKLARLEVGNEPNPKKENLAGWRLSFLQCFFFSLTHGQDLTWFLIPPPPHRSFGSPPRSFDLDTVFSHSVYPLPPLPVVVVYMCSVNIRKNGPCEVLVPIPPFQYIPATPLPLFSLAFFVFRFSLLSFHHPPPSPAIYLQVQNVQLDRLLVV